MDVLLRRHLEHRSRTDALLLGADWQGVDAINRAIGFCDLVGYTALSQQITTEELAAVLKTFENDASDLITEHGGHVVKLIGDEIMFVASDAEAGADVALLLAERFHDRSDVPPVRVGVAEGNVVTREGDYFGPVVNLAARIVKLAPPSAVLAPASMRDKLARATIEDVGNEVLKGFDDPVDLIRITRCRCTASSWSPG
jgi:adenylate cyclase